MLRSNLSKFYKHVSHSQIALLVVITALAFLVRYVGIWHNLPTILHPDEPTVVRSALALRFNVNPKHFDWPHFYIYANYFVYIMFAKMRALVELQGLKPLLSSIFPLMWNDNLVFYILTRFFSTLLGSLSVIPIYLAGKYAFSMKVGLYAALILAITPYHVWHSQYSLIDIPMVFFTSWVLYFSVRILREQLISNYIGAGILLGIAASTKYNGALFAIVIVLAHLFRILFSKDENLFSYKNILNIICAGLVSIVFFVLGTPFALLDYETFSITSGPKGAFWQFTNVGSVSYTLQLTKFLGYFFSKLADDFGFTFMYLYLAGLVYSIYVYIKTRQLPNIEVILLYVCSLIFFYYIAGFYHSRSHYYFIAYPLVIVLCGYFYDLAVTNIKHKKLLMILIFLFWLFPVILVADNTVKRVNSNKLKPSSLEIDEEQMQFSTYDQ